MLSEKLITAMESGEITQLRIVNKNDHEEVLERWYRDERGCWCNAPTCTSEDRTTTYPDLKSLLNSKKHDLIHFLATPDIKQVNEKLLEHLELFWIDLHSEFETTSGDITPEQNFAHDHYLEEIGKIMVDVIAQNQGV